MNMNMKKVDNYKWIIEREGKMRVPGIIFSSENLLKAIKEDNSIEQVKNVAHLPGIQKYSLAMPDIHWGYGFPIGGVGAMDIEEGVISPGGVGYDINCGVRMIKTDLLASEIKGKIEELINKIYSLIPCGVGSESDLNVSFSTLKKVLEEGSFWAVSNGFGWDEDLEYTEERGRLEGVDPDIISERALERGKQQLGTLGSGNHFIEIQKVSEIFDEKAAEMFGLKIDSVTIMIHTGSRGLGHQICSDWINKLMKARSKFKIDLPDEQLICAPLTSEEGKGYLSSMRAAANFAWANRQIILSRLREAFSKVFEKPAETLGIRLIYDVAHNIAKIEEHIVDGKLKKLCVHRKGATRAFPPGHPELPLKYSKWGQPVLIPGDMGTASYILLGTQKAMEETFGSTCHGAGRVLSRKKALQATGGRDLTKELREKGIYVKSKSVKTLREEAPDAYKDIDEVVEVVDKVGLSKKVVKMIPIAVVKG
ncbi:MAG: RtcB family protein [candidate division WOR-3 bacterium]